MKKWVVTLLLFSYSVYGVPIHEDDLRTIAFSDKYSMTERWNAFMSYVQKENKNSMPEIKSALLSEDWFMRDAALKILPLVDAQVAKDQAQIILQKDKSLIVRTTAVDILKSLNDKASAKLLWEALKDKKNFRKKQSLWIRPRILTTLIAFEDKNYSEYIKLLDDSDIRLQKLALFALEKFMNKKMGNDKDSLDIHIGRWKTWWTQQHTL